MIADGTGRAIAFRLALGQAHELPQAMALLGRLPDVPRLGCQGSRLCEDGSAEGRWVVGDRGYTSHAFRTHIWELGARTMIPPQRHEVPVACPGWVHVNRNHVERLWARLKEWRAVGLHARQPATTLRPWPS